MTLPYQAMTFARRQRLAVLYEAQDGLCSICTGRMDPTRTCRDQSNAMRPTEDHVLPTGLRGHDGPGNILAAHARCNERKGCSFPTDAELALLDRINTALGWPSLDIAGTHEASLEPPQIDGRAA